MKWNSNVGKEFTQEDAKLYNQIFAKSVTKQQAPFPPKSKHNKQPSTLKGGWFKQVHRQFDLKPIEPEHMHREFFTGHKIPVVFLMFIENGANFISIDMNGHIFVWHYNEE